MGRDGRGGHVVLCRRGGDEERQVQGRGRRLRHQRRQGLEGGPVQQPPDRALWQGGARHGRLHLHRRHLRRQGARRVHLLLQALRGRQGAHLSASLLGPLLCCPRGGEGRQVHGRGRRLRHQRWQGLEGGPVQQPQDRPQRTHRPGDGRLHLHRRDLRRQGQRLLHLWVQAQRRRQGAYLLAPFVGPLLAIDAWSLISGPASLSSLRQRETTHVLCVRLFCQQQLRCLGSTLLSSEGRIVSH